MGPQFVHDVRPEQYAAVIRELIRHENDVTNHRIMWLLIVQGLFVNARVVARQDTQAAAGIELAGIFVTLSAFVMLYKSYQARGYLQYLGMLAKRGELAEQCLGLDGWPNKRIMHWRRAFWICPLLQHIGDVLEPYLFLPVLIVSAWIFLLLLRWMRQPVVVVGGAAVFLAILILSLFSLVWVWWESTDEKEDNVQPDRS